MFQGGAPSKPRETQKKVSVFGRMGVMSRGLSTKSEHAGDNQQKPEIGKRNKSVDYDIKSVSGLNKSFRDKLESALSNKPKPIGKKTSSKVDQEAIADNTRLQATSKQRDVAIQSTTTNAPSPAMQSNLLNASPPPPPPPPAASRRDTSLKSNVGYQRNKKWGSVENVQQEKKSRGTRTTTPKTQQSQDMMAELSKVLARQKKS